MVRRVGGPPVGQELRGQEHVGQGPLLPQPGVAELVRAGERVRPRGPEREGRPDQGQGVHRRGRSRPGSQGREVQEGVGPQPESVGVLEKSTSSSSSRSAAAAATAAPALARSYRRHLRLGLLPEDQVPQRHHHEREKHRGQGGHRVQPHVDGCAVSRVESFDLSRRGQRV